jgi:hypothetical protein
VRKFARSNASKRDINQFPLFYIDAIVQSFDCHYAVAAAQYLLNSLMFFEYACWFWTSAPGPAG